MKNLTLKFKNKKKIKKNQIFLFYGKCQTSIFCSNLEDFFYML